jgi:hypothetical protein
MNIESKELVVLDRSLNRVAFVNGQVGTFRAIVKVQAGFMTVVDDLGIQANWGKKQWNSAVDVFRGFKKGALQSIQFKADNSRGAAWLTIFARVGKKVKVIDNSLLASLTVGDINQNWSESNLYSQTQYNAVGAKTWADMAFVMNNR